MHISTNLSTADIFGCSDAFWGQKKLAFFTFSIFHGIWECCSCQIVEEHNSLKKQTKKQHRNHIDLQVWLELIDSGFFIPKYLLGNLQSTYQVNKINWCRKRSRKFRNFSQLLCTECMEILLLVPLMTSQFYSWIWNSHQHQSKQLANPAQDCHKSEWYCY